MRKTTDRHWLALAEYLSLASSVAGSVVAITSQQIVYAAAPLTVALSLSLANRHRLQQQTQQKIVQAITDVRQEVESLHNKVQVLPPTEWFSSVESSTLNSEQIAQLMDTRQELDSLVKAFNTRSEPKKIDRLNEALSALLNRLEDLPPPTESFDPTALKLEIERVKQSINNIQKSTLSTVDDTYQNLSKEIKCLSTRVDALPTAAQLVDLSRVEAEIHTVKSQLQATKLSFSNSSDNIQTELQTQIDQLNQQLQNLPPVFDLDSLDRRLAELEKRNYSIFSAHINSLISALEHLQLNEALIQETIAGFTGQLDSLELRFNNLPIQAEAVDLNAVEELRQEVQQLRQTTQIFNCLTLEIEELKQRQQELGQSGELQQQLKDLDVSNTELHDYTRQQAKQLEQSIAQFDEAIAALERRTQGLSKTLEQLEDVLQLAMRLDERISALDERTRNLVQIEQQLENVQDLADGLDERLECLQNRTQDLDEMRQQLASLWQLMRESVKTMDFESALATLTEEITNQFGTSIETQVLQLKAHLYALDQQFKTRVEPEALKQLDRKLVELEQSFEELATTPVQVDLSQVEATISKISASLVEFATQREIALLSQQFTQVAEGLKQATGNLTERVDSLPLIVLQQQLSEAQVLIEGLDASNAALHDRTRNLDGMKQQLETVKQLAKEELGRLSQHISVLNVNAEQYAEKEELQRLRQELINKTDVSVKNQVVELNKLLRTVQSTYNYELVCERSESRKCLLKAIQEAEERLILVCPWPAWGIDDETIKKLEILLKRNVCIDIGWGHLNDILKLPRNGNKITRQTLQSSSKFYNALPMLETLEQKYPHQFKLKILGTHEKYLVCDRSFAMLGSHNFLTSNDNYVSDEREVGLQTNDPNIITNLIERFDKADNLELNTRKPEPDIDMIPF